MPTSNRMTALYDRLGKVGLPAKYVRDTALPSWWDDSVADNPAGYAQGLLILSRHLGLDLASLQDEAAPVRLRDFGACKYKKAAAVGTDQLAICRAMATRAAQLAAEATATPAQPVPSDPLTVRRAVLGGGARWVGLGELLDYCWDSGVPVLHFGPGLPRKACRPDGFAAWVNGHPVIILCNAKRQPAWQLFVLAHELGHIACGHVTEGAVLVDDKVEASAADDEERQANEYAAELLTGRPPKRFHAAGRWPSAEKLAAHAVEIGRSQQIDPGHVVLNYANTMGARFYPVANAALGRLDPAADAARLIRRVMADRLDWSSLPEDSSEFLMRVTGGRASG